MKYKSLLCLITLLFFPGGNGKAQAQNDYDLLPFGEDVIITEMSYHQTGSLPSRVEGEASSQNNTAHAALTAAPGQEGWVDARVGADIQWDSSQYDWEEVKDLPFEVTVNFSYEIGANWVAEHGSANGGVAIHALDLPWYDFIGFETNETGSRGGTFTETYTATLENWYGVIFQVYSQAHSTGTPPDGIGTTHTSFAEVTVHSIEVDFPSIDLVSPSVTSTTRADSNPTSASFVDFTVNFSEAVTGVTVGDFTLTTTGVAGASVIDVSGSGAVYTITAKTGSGNGTIRLDVSDDDTIMDGAGNPLGGTGLGNGDFTTGEVYLISKYVIVTQTGWIRESSENSNVGSVMNSITDLLYVGDNGLNRQYRSILSFNTKELPDNAVITNVRLRFKVKLVVGSVCTPPTTHGNLVVDIKKPYFGTSAFLEFIDFQSEASRNSIGVWECESAPGWYTIKLKSTAYRYINLKGITQFRLRFQKDDDDDWRSDYIRIFSSNASEANQPRLIVEYDMP